MFNKPWVFRILPGSWGLKGKAYAEAEACFLYTGEELDRKLVEIRHEDAHAFAYASIRLDEKYGHITAYEADLAYHKLDYGDPLPEAQQAYIDHLHGKMPEAKYQEILLRERYADNPSLLKLQLLENSLKYKLITQREYDESKINLAHVPESLEHELALLDLKLKYREISDHEYAKSRATLHGEPWVGIVENHFDVEDGIGGFKFTFDWNDFWISFLQDHGYEGSTEQELMDDWFLDMCRSQMMESSPDEYLSSL